MDKQELILALIDIQLEQIKADKAGGYCEYDDNHIKADELLLKYINDEMVTKAFNDIEKWYS